MNHPLPLSDEETLLLAKWIKRCIELNGEVRIGPETGLRLVETLYWHLTGSRVEIREPAP